MRCCEFTSMETSRLQLYLNVLQWVVVQSRDPVDPCPVKKKLENPGHSKTIEFFLNYDLTNLLN